MDVLVLELELGFVVEPDLVSEVLVVVAVELLTNVDLELVGMVVAIVRVFSAVVLL